MVMSVPLQSTANCRTVKVNVCTYVYSVSSHTWTAVEAQVLDKGGWLPTYLAIMLTCVRGLFNLSVQGSLRSYPKYVYKHVPNARHGRRLHHAVGPCF